MATTPIIDKSRRFSVWSIKEIYTGPDGVGRFVPNVDDLVIDWSSGMYRVINVDHEVTNLSRLVKVNFNTLGGGADDSDYAVLTGVGANSNSFRVYVDTSTVPHTLAVDSRTLWHGDSSYIKIFYGTDTSVATGKVISAIVNNTGNIVSENIPLILTIVPNGVNINEKTPATAWCSETVMDGDVVTIVAYTPAGQITSVDKFIISTSNLIRSIDQSSRYVTNIELLSPFMSPTDNRLVECPINLLTPALNFQAKVTYSDNSSRVGLIDGLKWDLFGLDSFIGSQLGKTDRLLLTYTLAPEELAMDATAPMTERKVVREYRIRTTAIDTYYAVKLFAVPKWNPTFVRYELSWYLYNLERRDIIDVTNFVEYSTVHPGFDGKRFNSNQTLHVSFNMQRLGAGYSYYVHPQIVNITLLATGTTKAANSYYTISYSNNMVYGDGVKGIYTSDEMNANMMKLDISCGHRESETWIANIYRPLDAINYSESEALAPKPTHAKIIIGEGTWVREVAIEDIYKPIRNINAGLSQGASIRLELFRREGGIDLQLAVAPILATTPA